MIVKDNLVIMSDCSIARISDDGMEIEFYMNFETGGWRKPYTKKGEEPKRSFKIKSSSRNDAIEKLTEIENYINENKKRKTL